MKHKSALQTNAWHLKKTKTKNETNSARKCWSMMQRLLIESWAIDQEKFICIWFDLEWVTGVRWKPLLIWTICGFFECVCDEWKVQVLQSQTSIFYIESNKISHYYTRMHKQVYINNKYEYYTCHLYLHFYFYRCERRDYINLLISVTLSPFFSPFFACLFYHNLAKADKHSLESESALGLFPHRSPDQCRPLQLWRLRFVFLQLYKETQGRHWMGFWALKIKVDWLRCAVTDETCLKSSTVWAWVSAVPATDSALCAWGLRWGAMGLLAGEWGTEAARTGWWPGPLGPPRREGLGRLATRPSGTWPPCWSGGGAGTLVDSALASPMSMEPSTLALLCGLRGLEKATGWEAAESDAETAAAAWAAIGAAATPGATSSGIRLWPKSVWSIPSRVLQQNQIKSNFIYVLICIGCKVLFLGSSTLRGFTQDGTCSGQV